MAQGFSVDAHLEAYPELCSPEAGERVGQFLKKSRGDSEAFRALCNFLKIPTDLRIELPKAKLLDVATRISKAVKKIRICREKGIAPGVTVTMDGVLYVVKSIHEGGVFLQGKSGWFNPKYMETVRNDSGKGTIVASCPSM